MTRNRATVPVERLEQPASLKANFLLSAPAEQQQNRCRNPRAGNFQWLDCVNDLMPPAPRLMPHLLVVGGRRPSRVAFLRGHLLKHCASVEQGIAAVAWIGPAEDRAGKKTEVAA